MDNSPKVEKGRKRNLGVSALLVLVVACGLLIWAAKSMRESLAPVHRWARLIQKGTPEQRREAAVELTHLSVRDLPVAIPTLATAAGDEDEQAAILAIKSLTAAARVASRSNNADMVRTAAIGLVGGLKDNRVEVRKTAAAGLAAARDGATAADVSTDALIEALSDSSVEVRASAAMVLAHPGTGGKHLHPLFAVLANDTSTQVRREAALAIGQTASGYDRATVALLNVLDEGDPQVRDASNSALFALKDAKKERRSGAIVPDLIHALTSREPRARTHAAACLGEVGPYAADSLTALLVVFNEAAPPAAMLRTPGDLIRWNPPGQAALALGQIAPTTPRAQEIAGALIERLRTERSDKLRAAIAEGLAAFPPELIEPALPILLAGLKETIGQANPPAPSFCYAIGRANPASPLADQAVELLSSALDAKDLDTQSEAARAIARFGARARSALPRLRVLAKSKDAPWIQQAAEASIVTIEGAIQDAGP